MKATENITRLLLTIMLVLALSACSNKDNNDANTTGEITETSQAGGEAGTASNDNTGGTTGTTTSSGGGTQSTGGGSTDANSNDSNNGTATDSDSGNTDSSTSTENNSNNTVEDNTTNQDNNTSADNNTTQNTDDNTSTENNNTNSTDDNTTEQNTTSTLKSLTLTLAKTTLNKDETTDLSLQATYADNSSKTLTNNIEWIVSPSNGVQIVDHTLIAKKDSSVTVQAKVGNILSNTIALNITWVVNGHVLPPEPDKALNDSTLLGIDVNDNGVRDDVERWIYETYDHPIERGIFMQSARAYNLVIVDPSKAHETKKYSDNAVSCSFYWIYEYISIPFDKYDFYDHRKKLKFKQFNNLKRHMAYKRYQGELSGGVYPVLPSLKEKCEFDDSGVLGDMK